MSATPALIDYTHLAAEIKRWAREFGFADAGITRIVTIEASGIGIAAVAALSFHNVPVVYAKKTESLNVDGEVYRTKIQSFTKKRIYDVFIGKKYIQPEDRVLIIDDFLANGKALEGLISIIEEQAGATVAVRTPADASRSK